MSRLPYAKMNGAGNAILLVDLRGTDATLTGTAARRLGANPRLRFDQLMAIGDPRTAGTDAFVEIFNIDGSRAGACGNGTRCVAWTLGRSTDKTNVVMETVGGLLASRRLGPTTFAVDMGAPRLDWSGIPLGKPVADTADVALHAPPGDGPTRFSAVGMGNPHAVFFVPDADAIDLGAIGPQIEHDSVFPDRANVSFAQILSRDAIALRVWERGAGATLACGSAACATLVAAARAGLTGREARIGQKGGDLQVAWRTGDDHVVMTGPVELEHEGLLSLDLLEFVP